MFRNSRVTVCDVLVIGGGLAGLSAATAAAEAGKKTVVVSKNHPLRSHSTAAAGGINAALSEEDAALHIEETIAAGCGLCSRNAVEILCREAVGVINRFLKNGTPFQWNETRNEPEGRPFGAMSTPRTRFVGDRTGAALMQTAFEQAKKAGVRFEYSVFLIDLIKHGSRMTGVYGIRFETGAIEFFSAGAVILATGGAGALFDITSNGIGSTGDGAAMALRAGVPLRDWELIQFHPTGLYPSGFLISEAARGEGAILRNKNMEAFMGRYHEKADLAPRDAVTRAIVTELKCGRGFGKRGDFVLLDCRNIPPERLFARLPELCDLTETVLHIHPTTHLIPVIPTAHYFMGGVACDLDGRALDGIGFPVPGLYAAGECACTGVHGANRVGGNSLLEAVVFGTRAGQTAAAECADLKTPSSSPEAATEAAASFNERLTLFQSDNENSRGSVETPLDCRRELKEIMSAYCSTAHTTVRHKQGIAKLTLLNRRFARCRLKNGLGQPFNTELKDFLETENLLFLAAALFSAAEERSESVGAFYREDQLYAGAAPYHTATEWRKGRFLTERRPL